VASPALVGFDLTRRLGVVWGEDAARLRDDAGPLLRALNERFGHSAAA
jgi:hypothetical protein